MLRLRTRRELMVIPGGISLPKHGFVFLVSFLIMSSLILSHAKEDHGNDGDAGRGGAALGRDPNREDKEGPEPVERAIEFPGLTSHWNALRAWVKHAWLSFRPPESVTKSASGSNVGEVMKEAAARSFETSKETMEKAASTAAEAAEEAVEKTKEKVKRTLSKPGVGGQDADAEL